MAKKSMKILWKVLGSFGIVGGLVHVLSALNIYNLLGLFGTYAMWVQLVAGASAILYIGKVMLKKK